MSSNRHKNYLSKHRQIKDKLTEITNITGRGCVDVSQLSRQVGMDVRTVRNHLEIMEADSVGVFVDSTKKQFCTVEGITLLANFLKTNRSDNE